MSNSHRKIGFLLFNRITLLDLAGPYEILARLPNTTAELISQTMQPVVSDLGVTIHPQTTYELSTNYSVIVVPGGPGQQTLMDDEATLSFLRRESLHAEYICSVCTGSLVLGAAGLLQGYKATCHWTAMEVLKLLGAIPTRERIVIDRNRITGAGVSAGIDLALVVAALLESEECAKELQLTIEYDPSPPFSGGAWNSSDKDLIEKAASKKAELTQARLETAKLAAQRLNLNASDKG